MKVLYLHQYFATPEMNGGTRSFEFARRLVAAGHEVHMITSDRDGAPATYETMEAGVRVTWIPVAYSNKKGRIGRVWAFLLFAIRASLVSVNSKADVVVATSTPLTIAIPGIIAKWRYRIPMVFEVRDPWPEMLIGLGALRNPFFIALAKLFERFVYRKSDRIIALSDGMKDVVVSTGYDEDLIDVIYNACDLDVFDVPESSGTAFRYGTEWLQDRKLILYAGSLGIANGVDYLVHVAEQMLKIDPEIRFLVVGTGGQEDRIKALATENGTLGVNFFMLSPMPKKELPKVFSAADISLVLLKDIKELWTNSSNKFFDGLAAGRPVVVNNVGWQASLLNETAAGFDIDPRDYRRAAEKLYRHLTDTGWMINARKNARALAISRFSREDLAKQFENVLVKALGE